MTFLRVPGKAQVYKKLISIFLIHAFVLSNIAFAVPQESQAKIAVPGAVTNPENIVVPREFGIVKTKFTGKEPMLVIHIQDAHCNYEAQSNIVKILENLYKNYNVNLVSVEGADGVIDTSWFKAFPDEEVRKEVADYFMKKGEITGPEFLSITSDYNIKLFGAETRSYYIDNLNAFTASYPLKGDTEKYLNNLKSALNRLKGFIYSDDLKLMDAKAVDYESKKLQFNDYVKFLQSEAEKAKINLRSYENLFKLISVLVYEKKIDFNVTDKERSVLIDELSKLISKDTLTELVNKSLEFKSGKISSADYYAYLKSLAVKNGIEMGNTYPNLYNYIIYNSVYSKIENEKLFNDIKKLEIDIKEKLFTNDDQRTLEKLSRHIDILIGLVNIKLLNDDFEYFEKNKAEFSHEIFADFIKKKTAQYALAYELEEANDAVSKSLPKLEDFYSIAIKRDKALVDNTLGQMKKEKANIAVLVTGGFHSEGISKLLEKQGVSYMVVCPSITKDVPTPYIQILTNQRTPLEDILVKPVHADEGKVAKGDLLAPYLISAARQLSKRERVELSNAAGAIRSRGLENRISDFYESWEPEYIQVWMKGSERFANKRGILTNKDLMFQAFMISVRSAVAKGKLNVSAQDVAAIESLARLTFDRMYEAQKQEMAGIDAVKAAARQATTAGNEGKTIAVESAIGEQINGFIQDAEANKPVYITNVKKALDGLAAGQSEEISFILDFGEEYGQRQIDVKIPKLENINGRQLDFVRRYLRATLYNGMVSFGGYSMTVYYNNDNQPLSNVIEDIVKEMKDSRPLNAQGERYGQAINILSNLKKAKLGSSAPDFEIALKGNAEKPAKLKAGKEFAAMAMENVKNIPSGTVLVGVDAGGTDIKVLLSDGSKIIFEKVYAWKPSLFTKAEEHIAPVLLLVRMARAYASLKACTMEPAKRDELLKSLEGLSKEDAKYAEIESAVKAAESALNGKLINLAAIGVSWPDVVVDNKIVGGETSKTKGMRDALGTTYGVAFKDITSMDLRISQEFGGCPVGIINDGVMSAYTLSVETGENSVEGIAGGTSLGSGIVINGTPVPYVYAVSNLVYDLGTYGSSAPDTMPIATTRNNNTRIPGTMQKGPTQEGAFRLAVKYGLAEELKNKGLFIEENGEFKVAPGKEKQTLAGIIEMAKAGNENAKRVFVEMGESMAVEVALSGAYIPLMPDKRVFFGRVFEDRDIFGLIKQGMKKVLGADFNEDDFVQARENIANSPLMKALGSEKVAKLGQTVGALHLAHQTLLQKFGAIGATKKAPGTDDISIKESEYYSKLCAGYSRDLTNAESTALNTILKFIMDNGPPAAEEIVDYIKKGVVKLRIVKLGEAKRNGHSDISDTRFFPRLGSKDMGAAAYYKQFFYPDPSTPKKGKFISTIFIPEDMMAECMKNIYLGGSLILHEGYEEFVSGRDGLSRHAYANTREEWLASWPARHRGLIEFTKYYLDEAEKSGNIDYLYDLLARYSPSRDPEGDLLLYLHEKIHDLNGSTSTRIITDARELWLWFRNQLEYEDIAKVDVNDPNYPIDKMRQITDAVEKLISDKLVTVDIVNKALFQIDLGTGANPNDFKGFIRGAIGQDYLKKQCDYPHDMPERIWMPKASIKLDNSKYMKFKIPYRNMANEKVKHVALEKAVDALDVFETGIIAALQLKDPYTDTDVAGFISSRGLVLTPEETKSLYSLEGKDKKRAEERAKDIFLFRLSKLVDARADAWIEEKIDNLAGLLSHQMEILQNKNPNSRTVIAIAGPGGAGKSTITRLIKKRVVSGNLSFTEHGTDSDDYLHPSDLRYLVTTPQRVPLIEGGGMYDIRTLKMHIEALKLGRSFMTQGDPKIAKDPQEVKSSNINIIEGVYPAHEGEVRELLDMYIVLSDEREDSDKAKAIRKMLRDARRFTGRGGFTLPFGFWDYARKQYWEQNDVIGEDVKEADMVWRQDVNSLYIRKTSILSLVKDHYTSVYEALKRGVGDYHRQGPDYAYRFIDAVKMLLSYYSEIADFNKKARRQALRDIMEEDPRVRGLINDLIKEPDMKKQLELVLADINNDVGEEILNDAGIGTVDLRDIAIDIIQNSADRNLNEVNRIKLSLKAKIEKTARSYPILSKGWLSEAISVLTDNERSEIESIVKEVVEDARKNKKVVRLLPVGSRGTRYSQSTTGAYGVEKPFTETMRPDQKGALKTFLDCATERSLQGNTPQNVFAVTDKSIEKKVRATLAKYGISPNNIFGEPQGANTAAVMGIAAVLIGEQYGYDAVISAMTTDHDISDLTALGKSLDDIETQVALEPIIGILGIQPSVIDTSMGHVIRSDAPILGNPEGYNVQSFREKPLPEEAKALTEQGAVWNSGKFIFRANTALGAFEKFQPEYYSGLIRIRDAIRAAKKTNPGMSVIEIAALPQVSSAIKEAYAVFAKMKLPFEKAIVEKSAQSENATIAVDVVVFRGPWTDLGNSYQRYLGEPVDQKSNVIRAPEHHKVELNDTSNSNIEINQADRVTTVHVYGADNCLVMYDNVSNKVFVTPRGPDAILKWLYETQQKSPELKKYVIIDAPNPKGPTRSYFETTGRDERGNTLMLGNEGDSLILDVSKLTLTTEELRQYSNNVNCENTTVYSSGGLTAVAGLKDFTVIRRGRDIYVYGPAYQAQASAKLAEIMAVDADADKDLTEIKTEIANSTLSQDKAKAYIAAARKRFLVNFEKSGTFIRNDAEGIALVANYSDVSIAAAATKSFMALAQRIKDLHTKKSSETNNWMAVVALQVSRKFNIPLNQSLNDYGMTDEKAIFDRLAAIRNPEKFDPAKQSSVKKIFVLTRSKPGGEVSVNSVVMQYMKDLFPNANIVLIGPKKHEMLFSGMGITVDEPKKQSANTLSGLIMAGWFPLLDVLKSETEGMDTERECVVVDAFARPVFFSTLPVFKNDASSGAYLYFDMVPDRKGDSVATYGESVKSWLEGIFGKITATRYAKVAMPAEDAAFADTIFNRFGLADKNAITMTNGCGDDYTKAMTVEFEASLVKSLVGKGNTVIFDMGFSETELARADEIKKALEAAGISTSVVQRQNIRDIPADSKADVIFYRGSMSGYGALIGKSQQYIGYDSSFQHIASGLNIPITTVFTGYDSDEFSVMWSPYCGNYKNIIAVRTADKAALEHQILTSVLQSTEAYKNIHSLEDLLQKILPVAADVLKGSKDMKTAVGQVSEQITPAVRGDILTFANLVSQRDDKSVYKVSDKELATALRIMQMSALKYSVIENELEPNLVYYAWAGRANNLLVNRPGGNAIAEVWMNSTEPTGDRKRLSSIVGTKLNVGSVELPSITIKELVEAAPEILGEHKSKPTFVKFLCTRFAPKVHMGFSKNILAPGVKPDARYIRLIAILAGLDVKSYKDANALKSELLNRTGSDTELVDFINSIAVTPGMTKEVFIESLNAIQGEFIKSLVKERKMAYQLVTALQKWVNAQGAGITKTEFGAYRDEYEKWASLQADNGWKLKGVAPDLANKLPGFVFDWESLRANREFQVSMYNEISLVPGKVILSPVGFPHAIFGLSHQTHPPSEHPKAKNEAWIVISAGKNAQGKDEIIQVEPQEMSNVTYTVSDLYTPNVFNEKDGKPESRKNPNSFNNALSALSTKAVPLNKIETENDVINIAIPLIAARGLQYVATTPKDFERTDEVKDITSLYSTADNAKVESIVGGTYKNRAKDMDIWPRELFISHRITLGTDNTKPSSVEIAPEENNYYELLVTKGTVTVYIEGQAPKTVSAGAVLIPATIKTPSVIKATGAAEVLKFVSPVQTGAAQPAGVAPTGTGPAAAKPDPAMPAITQKPQETRQEKKAGKTGLTAADILTLSTNPNRDSLRDYLSTLTLSGTLDNRAVIIAYDTGLEPASNQAVQAGERPINRYLNGKLVNVRATGQKLLDNVKTAIAELEASGIPYKVVTIAGNGTIEQTGKELETLGKVINIQNPNNQHIPVIGLYELAIRIAYDRVEQDILDCLNRIAINPADPNMPFTLDDLKKGIIRVLPRIVPVNMAEAAEAYKAAQSALKSL